MMPFQQFFGDDEQTAETGPYERLLRLRKWLILSAAALFVVSKGLYRPIEVERLLRIVALPNPIVSGALLLSLAYLATQYVLLIVQLISTYDIVAAERFVSRRGGELEVARQRVMLSRQGRDQIASRGPDEGPIDLMFVENSTGTEDARERTRQRDLRVADENVRGAEADYERLIGMEPSQRPIYKYAEYAIDFIRIALPLVGAISAAWVSMTLSGA